MYYLLSSPLETEASFLHENSSWERPYVWAWAVELNRVLNASGIDKLRPLGRV
jgi:hypothetical protein